MKECRDNISRADIPVLARSPIPDSYISVVLWISSSFLPPPLPFTTSPLPSDTCFFSARPQRTRTTIIFERFLSAALLPITGAAFVTTGSQYPLIDALLGVSLVIHSHIGVSSLIPLFWFFFGYQMPFVGRALRLSAACGSRRSTGIFVPP